MGAVFTLEKVRKEKADTLLLTTLILLVGLGLAVLASASYFKAGRLPGGNPWYFVQKQLLLIALGAAGGWFLSRLSWEAIRKSVPVLLLVSALLMLATFLPVWDAGEILGARRWIVKFGFTFQPAELVKLTVVIYLASMFDKKKDSRHDPVTDLLPPFAVSFFFVILTLLQNDYSSAMFLLFVILVMFYIAGVKLRYFLFVLGVGLILGVAGVLAAPYRMSRVLTFLSPDRDPTGASYQISASVNALSAGGFWGTGFGVGTHKLGGIPEVHNDFIFASLAEETGFWGVCLCFALFGLLAWRGFRFSLEQKEIFPRMIGFGLTTFLVYQMMINIAVVAGAIPATGVTLPFFSYGGSSIMISLLMAGLLVKLSRTGGEVSRAG